MKDGKVTIWMNLLGFNRDDEDRGVKRFLAQTGYKPEAVCALLCHSDFYNQHRGMDEEYVLPPDNCAYWGIPKNKERERQPWTNYDLKALAKNLLDEGIELYGGIFGSELDSRFHEEWIKDHPEIRRTGLRGAEGAREIFCLKRFKDGTYYEDFFIKKVCETLVDYGMTGIHLADAFCPSRGGMMHNMDFSTDFVGQFLDMTGLTLPDEISATMGDDTKAAEIKRSRWIYSNMREEWIRFNAKRWNIFLSKLATALHSVGKKLWIIGMYCTDPFETLYCNGIDLKGAVDAGVDMITANILPTSVYITGNDDSPYYFHKFMAIAPTTAAYIPKGRMISMLGLQDATEEWSVMHHAPCLHERDAYTVTAYRVTDKDGTRRAVDGYFLCLGDGIPREDWDKERVMLEKSLSAKDAENGSAAMLWSDFAHEGMLCEYIKSRRWTPHKHFYELAKAGAMLTGTVRSDALDNYSGTLFVPNLDMLDTWELEAVRSYKRGPIICTARADYDASALSPTFSFKDSFSNIPMMAFCLGFTPSEEDKKHIRELISVDDGCENLKDIRDAEEFDNTLVDTLVFSKVNRGFSDAVAYLVREYTDSDVKINKPNMILRMKDGAYRLYIFNDSDIHYHRAFVTSRRPIERTVTVSDFPVLPPRFIEKATDNLHHAYDGRDAAKFSFEIKIQPGGVTVIDVYLEEK